MLERGRAHPILGPFLLVALVLLLAIVFVHMAHEGMDAATEVGAICFGIATFLGLVVLDRLRVLPLGALSPAPPARGPPGPRQTYLGRPTTIAASSLSIPLRR